MVIAGEVLGTKAVTETSTPNGFVDWIFAPGTSLELGGTVERSPPAHAYGTFLQPGSFGSENARK